MSEKSEFDKSMHMLMEMFRNLPHLAESDLSVYSHGERLYSIFDQLNNMLVLVFADSVEDAKKKAGNGIALPVDLKDLGIRSE